MNIKSKYVDSVRITEMQKKQSDDEVSTKKRNTAVLPVMYSDLKPKQCSYMIKSILTPNIGGNKND